MKDNSELHWGIDLGGTKVECAVLDNDAKPIIRERIPTEASGGYEHVVGRIGLLIDRISQQIGHKPNALGCSTPGMLDRKTQCMKFSNSTVLNGQPLKKSLEDCLGIPCMIENDANCFGYAEVMHGVVQHDYPDAKCVFAVIMGTGVGGAVLVDGKIINGPHQLTGEWGHNILVDNGPPCYCGKYGCVETLISGTGVQNHYHTLTGQRATLQEILDKQQQGEQAAADTIHHLYTHYGIAIARLINLLDPDVIVIGGGLSNIPSLFTEGRKHILRELFNHELLTPIVPPLLGDSAGVFGAAFLHRFK